MLSFEQRRKPSLLPTHFLFPAPSNRKQNINQPFKMQNELSRVYICVFLMLLVFSFKCRKKLKLLKRAKL